MRRHKGKKRPEYRKEPEQDSQLDREMLLSQVWTLAGPLCEYEGVELVHVDYQRESRGRILRLYIDRAEGVTLDDCSQISRQVGDLLDVELEHAGPYSLEVSSPGIDRPISREKDFARYEGEEAQVKTTRPIDGRRHFKGILAGISDGTMKIRVDGGTVAIPFREIRSARLIGALNGPDRPNGA